MHGTGFHRILELHPIKGLAYKRDGLKQFIHKLIPKQQQRNHEGQKEFLQRVGWVKAPLNLESGKG